MTGLVSLVGAGPGDPELLTVKAVKRLEEADVVLYDALVSDEVLKLARDAQCFDVGKRKGCGRIEQEAIHELMIQCARGGDRLVRLKGGDPFVLGRGGEEALALARAGVPYEIVPGISSALAAPALAGMPVTHRGITSAFVVLSGHSPEALGTVLGSIEPHSVTLVVLMGLSTRTTLAELLIERGWSRETPAAITCNASSPDTATWTGTIATLSRAPVPLPGAPGVIIVGDVVSLGATISKGSKGSEVAVSSKGVPV